MHQRKKRIQLKTLYEKLQAGTNYQIEPITAKIAVNGY